MIGEGHVYFLQAGGPSGRIKIGRSTSVVRRIRDLYCASGVDLKPLAIIRVDDPVRVEREMHNRLRPHRIHGEWFNPHPDVFQIIADASIDHDIMREIGRPPQKPGRRKRSPEDPHEPGLDVPRMIRFAPADVAAQNAAAAREGRPWANWARKVLAEAAARTR